MFLTYISACCGCNQINKNETYILWCAFESIKISFCRQIRGKKIPCFITRQAHTRSCAHAKRTGWSSTPAAASPTVRPSVSAVMINGGPRSRNLFALPLDGEPQMGINMHIFTRGEAIHLSQNVAPGRWDKRPLERGNGSGAHSTQILGGVK